MAREYQIFKGWSIRIKLEPRDLWVGLYWDNKPQWFDVYICIIPVVPIHIRKVKG